MSLAPQCEDEGDERSAGNRQRRHTRSRHEPECERNQRGDRGRGVGQVTAVSSAEVTDDEDRRSCSNQSAGNQRVSLLRADQSGEPAKQPKQGKGAHPCHPLAGRDATQLPPTFNADEQAYGNRGTDWEKVCGPDRPIGLNARLPD